MSDNKILIGDMSHETAIGILKLMLEAMQVYDGISPTPERINALKMAIEEMSVDTIPKKKLAQALTKIESCSFEWYVGRLDRKPDEVVLMEDVEMIILGLLNEDTSHDD